MVIRFFGAENLWSHCVPVKGADGEDYAAGVVSAVVLWLGHLEVILKGDNEPALQALVERTLTMLRVKVQEEDPSVNLKKLSKEVPPKYDSQSNGGAEVGVRLVRSPAPCPGAVPRRPDRQVHPGAAPGGTAVA